MIEFHVPDMSCGHCVAAITRALQALDPGARVQAELPERRIRVDSARPAETLRQALEDAGYPPAPGAAVA